MALFLALASAQAGWVEDTPDGTVIHVKVWKLPDSGNPETYNQAESAGVELFKKRFPEIFKERWAAKYKADPKTYGDHDWDNVRIELHPATGIRVEGVEADLLAIAGGMAEDVLYVNFRKSDNYIQNGFLYPLDEYMAMMTEEQKDFRINEKLWPVIRRVGPDGEKHTWAMPFGGALGKVLLYRKDLFDKHDLPYPDVNYTWERLIHDAAVITDPANGIYGFELGKGKNESWWFVNFLWSAGADIMEYDEETNQWSCVFDSDAAVRALDFYLRLSAERWEKDGKVYRGYSSKDSSESASAKWNRGEIGMRMDYIDERLFSRINPELTGMVPVPLGAPNPETGERVRGGELNSRMLGLFSEIKNPVVRDAAWEYIRFYDGDEATRIKTRVMVEGGYGRFVNPKLLRKYGYPEVERLAPPGWSETFELAIATGRPEPYGRNSNFAYELLTVPIQEAEDLMRRDDERFDSEEARFALLKEMLVEANAVANEKMIGLVTPEERLQRRIVAWVVLVAIMLAFGYVFRKMVQVFTPPESRQAGKKKWDFVRYKWAYLLVLPGVLTVLVWQYVPLARGSLMAFYDYRLIGESTFVGVDNFGDLLFDRDFWLSIWYALKYSFLVLALTFLPPIILAIALQEVPQGKLAYRLIFYLPAVITGIVTALLWKQFYEPSERGALNALVMHIPALGYILIGLFLLGVCLIFARRLLVHDMYAAAAAFVVAGILLFIAVNQFTLGILMLPNESVGESLKALPGRMFAVWQDDAYIQESYRWLSNSSTALLACVIPMVWAGMGPGCLIYLAALKGIPEDYYEAADIDGATFVDKILFVVFPMLKALIIINFVGAFIGCWYSATGNILVMTGGGYGTEVVGLHIWYKAFTFLKFGPATAAAWMLGFMLIGFTVHQLRILSRVEFRTAGKKD